ncbi:MAG: aspartate--tRNA ligase [Spirochaetaceae bacterium]|jgi:aspartyl-tRNA synthetase|nr:aspartate--tRNA ligase [Spirochaetaceae bacterium]
MEQHKRTVNCGAVSLDLVGKELVLNGWVQRLRNLGGIFFISLRDRYGVVQIVVDDTSPREAMVAAAELHNEYCIAVHGCVRERPGAMKNEEMASGAVEVLASGVVILNRCQPLPFQIDDGGVVKEELRLKYRYLDLRSAGMQRRIALRHKLCFAVREFLQGEDFFEIETPTLIKSTPEGARDYLVPSRLYAGMFYALPQSPQLYKQLLMVSGFDKYFQIARCYRDEDARGDRQMEFTQIDIEMSFVGRDDVLAMTERLMAHVFGKTLAVDLPAPFPRLSFAQALEMYGSDKPDLRFGLALQDFSAFAAASDFAAFTGALRQGEMQKQEAAVRGISGEGGAVKALVVPGGSAFSRKQIEELEAHAKIYKAAGLAWMKVAGEDAETLRLEGGVAKFFAGREREICAALGARSGDLVLLAANASRKIANISLGAVRTKLGRDLHLTDAKNGAPRFSFVWIVDFPLFEYDAENGRWEAAHHMFSAPQEQFLETMERDPGAVLGDLYDLVLNGYELASGSIRIHDGGLQKRVFKLTGLSDDEAERRFGFLTNAFTYGAPPHGGIAPGLDRLAMLMAGETSIKEVIAFPKNSFAQGLMDESPAPASQKQLDELHLHIVPPAD